MIDLHKITTEGSCIPIKNVCNATPFASGVEYSAPARGMWTIAHISMLIPGSHQIYVCASACLRGVVLSAAEFSGLDRFSMIELKENDILEGNLEELFIEGITDILHKLPSKPTAVLPFTSCIHHFLACDLNIVYQTLRIRFPDIDFINCWMNPTMRNSKLTPDEHTRMQLYNPLEYTEKDSFSINIIGNTEALKANSDCLVLLKEGGYQIRDICQMDDYKEFKNMSRSQVNLYFQPSAKASAKKLEKRLEQKALYLPFCYDYKAIEEDMTILANYFSLSVPDFLLLKKECEDALKDTLSIMKNIPIAIDYTATPRPLELARFLISHGFSVIMVYLDAITNEDFHNVVWLKEHAPNLEICATIHYKCRILPRNLAMNYNGLLLAIGQKAAYFTGTKHFVNLIENGGLYGFNGIKHLAVLMKDAILYEKDTKEIITIKGWGCKA